MKKLNGLAFGVLLSTALTSGAVLADKGLGDGVYTKEQAAKGKSVFDQSCKACHDKEFYRAKLPAWKGQSLAALIDTISVTMPEDNAGGLYMDDYVNVMAYVLYSLKYPAGEAPMSMDDGSMDSIIIDAE